MGGGGHKSPVPSSPRLCPRPPPSPPPKSTSLIAWGMAQQRVNSNLFGGGGGLILMSGAEGGQQGDPRKKIPDTTVAFFFGGYPRRGMGVRKKNLRENFSGPQKLKIFDFYHTFLNVEGARRIPFKVFIQILADMGGICVWARRPPVCSGCTAAPHPGLLSAGKSPQMSQCTSFGARNRTSSIEGQG